MTEPLCSVIIATRNRRELLLANLGALVPAVDGLGEIIVVDNGSEDETGREVGRRYPQVRLIGLKSNLGSAARNVGAEAAGGRYLVMLDDDSRIERDGLVKLVAALQARPELAAIGCVVRLASDPQRHEAGGLPGVFIGCGAAIRRDDLLAVGGYPQGYEYYVEEYDVCCRLWRRGRAVTWAGEVVVWHERAAAGRDANNMLRLLTRNNLWLWNCYAPAARRRELIEQTVERYGRIARREGAMVGYQQGLGEARARLNDPRSRRYPLSEGQFRAMFGLPAAGEILRAAARRLRLRRVGLYQRGKGAEQLLEVLAEAGLNVPVVVDDASAGQQWRERPVVAGRDLDRARPEAIVIGSLSPGVAQDLARQARRRFEHLPVITCVGLPRLTEASEPVRPMPAATM